MGESECQYSCSPHGHQFDGKQRFFLFNSVQILPYTTGICGRNVFVIENSSKNQTL